jgi:hypothetical protein
MDDLGQPGRFPPGPETSASGYYGGSVRAARAFVGGVPASWPKLLRVLVQIPLIVLAVVFVLLAWAVATVTLLVSSLGGSASARY